MPIEKNLFDLAKDPSQLILKFLERNSEKAFTAGEIRDSVRELEELRIPLQKIEDTLDFLVQNNDVEVAWLKGQTYYKIKEKDLLGF